MPKENKSASRRSRRQCPEVDNETPSKSIIGGNRYSPFSREPSRRDSRTEKNVMALPTTEVLHTISGSILGNGIKYIMFPLHLLRFCIFGATSASADTRKSVELEETKSSGKKHEEERKERKPKDREERSKNEESSSSRSSKVEKESRSVSKSTSGSEEKGRDASHPKESSKEKPRESSKEEDNDTDYSTDEMVTAVEDSDSSVDQWSSARSTMIMNMSMELDTFDRSMSYRVLEEPMDISIDEHALERSYSAGKTARDSRGSESCRVTATGNASSRSRLDERNSNSVDEEIARIFQKQCTSSEDEYPPSSSSSSDKREKTRQRNFLYSERDNGFSASSSKKEQENEKERKKKTSSDYSSAKRRKVTQEEDRNEKQNDRRSEIKTREEKRSSRQETPSKHRSRSSRTPVKSKESKRKDVKYKETATQTDSAFSDDDVEMIPVETKSPEKKFCCKFAARNSQSSLFQSKEMEHELHYVADNEDSNDGYINVARKRISTCSTSSSTDLGFEERVSATRETDLQARRLHSKSPDAVNALRTWSRAPPGFPEVPQNPPLMSCTYKDSKHIVLSTIATRNSTNSSIVQTAAIVPPAPTPMRHLYYDYPEFMDLPLNVRSSRILKNILKNNYSR